MRKHTRPSYKVTSCIYSSSLPTSSSRKLSENPELSRSLARSLERRAFGAVLLLRRRRFRRAFGVPGARRRFFRFPEKIWRALLRNHATASVGDTQYTGERRLRRQRFRSLRIHVMGKVPRRRTWLLERSTRVFCVDLVSSRLALSRLASPRLA